MARAILPKMSPLPLLLYSEAVPVGPYKGPRISGKTPRTGPGQLHNDRELSVKGTDTRSKPHSYTKGIRVSMIERYCAKEWFCLIPNPSLLRW